MRACKDAPYAFFCQQVGDGSLPSASSLVADDPLCGAAVSLPPQICCAPNSSFSDLLHWVYEGFDELDMTQLVQFYENRAVLAPTNDATGELNAFMYSQLTTGREFVHYSKDSILGEAATTQEYTPEFLHSVTCTGMPPHKLSLRRGTLLILLRNYSPAKGLCNGLENNTRTLFTG